MPKPRAPAIAVEPACRQPWLADAVREAGAEIVPPRNAEALVWCAGDDAEGLWQLLGAYPAIDWVQLPWAGIEPFVTMLDHKRRWTCAKGAYAEPVAEHALAMALAGMRGVGDYARRRAWSGPQGRSLVGANVTILGGGGITRELLRLLAPFDCHVTVVRHHPEALDGADLVVGPDDLDDTLDRASLVVLALALTQETEHIIDADALKRMPEHAWLVNVARGRHIDTDALVATLRQREIAGAALDVTDPEPLPDGHALWDLANAIVTPHVALTDEMAVPLLSRRIAENTRRFAEGKTLLGLIDVDLGY